MDAIIIGGGITGLSTAIALNKVGISNRVFERAPQLNEVGAGIWMAPNALKVFDWLGFGEEVRQHGIPLQKVEITDQRLRPIRKANRSQLSDAQGNTIISIHRATLQNILFNQLPRETVFLNKEYLGHTEANGEVRVRFQDGEERGSILLGADGIRSQVRHTLFGEKPLRYSGQTCWRGVAGIVMKPPFESCCIEAWGRRIRFGFSAIAADKVYWYAVALAPLGQKDDPSGLKNRLLDLYKDFADPVRQILESTPDDKIIRSDISDLARLGAWHQGRTCLLGDAAHATTPNMGQGAAQGVEDACYFSHMLARVQDPVQAFALFQKERRKKVDYVVNTSWMLGKLIHHPLGQTALKLVNQLTPDKVLFRQMQELFAVEV